MKKIIVVIPTFNEKDNIEKTITRLQEVFKQINDFEMEILVVDANSPDGTGDMVKKLMENNAHLHLILEREGGEGGLGGAYILAFKHAMKHLSADYLFEMDADLQHNPKYVLDMVQALREGADCAQGTRFFIEGGSIPKAWGFHRKFLSYFGNLYARVVMGTYGLKDVTGGFRVTKVEGVLDKIDLDSLLSKRFAYKMDLIYRIYKLGAKVAQIPINFEDRDGGESKIAITTVKGNDFVESYKVVTLIGIMRNRKFIQVAIVGVIGAGVQYTVYPVIWYVLSKSELLSFNYVNNISLGIAIAAAIFSNFIFNNFWTFSKRRHTSGDVKKRLVKFYLTSSGSVVIQFVVMWLGLKLIPEDYTYHYIRFDTESIHLPPIELLILMGIGIFIGLVWNYIFYSKIIWKKK